MVKPEIILCEMVLNLSMLNTLTYLLTNILTSHGVSALGTTSIHFIEPGVKVRSILSGRSTNAKTSTRLSSAVRLLRVSSAPAHRARETIELLTMETTEFIPATLWPPNSLDLNPVDYKVSSIMQEGLQEEDQGH